MRAVAIFILLSWLAIGCHGSKSTQALATNGQINSWTVYFSPHGGCAEAIINELDKAKQSVFVQAYSFTSAIIAKGLVNAKRRGVQVEVILDQGQRKSHYGAVDFLLHAAIPTRLDGAHAIAHNKVIIIDKETVITGSFNFTRAAEERNAENLLILRDSVLAAKYLENWNNHARHSMLVHSNSY